MAYAEKMFSQVFNEYLLNLHTAMPCTVIVYYEDERKADLAPLFTRKRKKDGVVIESAYPLIEKAPVLKHVVKDEPLKPGDEVFVVFAERALDFAGNRRHDLTDAVVVGVF